MKPLTLTVSAFCAAFGIKRTKTYELIAQGELETLRLGRRRLITYRSAEALISRKVAEAAGRQQ